MYAYVGGRGSFSTGSRRNSENSEDFILFWRGGESPLVVGEAVSCELTKSGLLSNDLSPAREGGEVLVPEDKVGVYTVVAEDVTSLADLRTERGITLPCLA